MSDPHFNHDDPSIPVLTEVLDIPASGQPAGSGASSAAAAHAAAPGAAPLGEEALDALRVAVLQDLQVRLDPLLKSRMREHVQAAVDQALGDLVDDMQAEVARLVDEALHKELIRQAARQQLPRARPRDDVDDN
jgi:3-oxoacyl-ACP reductase-like protein